MENSLKVKIWGREVGMLVWDYRRKRAVFEYSKDFLNGGLDIAPLTASIKNPRNRLPFYGLQNDNIFYGLPAFISDSLPGRWGNTVFSKWAQANHINERDLTSVDKLSFIGSRAMGALEFEPAQQVGRAKDLALEDLYRKAQEILDAREDAVIDGDDLTLESLYEVGTSAGGQHTKAVIARNKDGVIRSGQIMLPEDYTYYLLKFAEKDYYPLTVVEYVYSQMAEKAGVKMMPCELVEIGGERHFLTERYDRKGGKKVHTQSLAAMNPEATSYEDLMLVCDALGLPYREKEEMYRRMVFNVLTTNVDAHIKNFSFMMEEDGDWHITPAYDLTFSCFNPGNRFDPAHALQIAGKSMGIGKAELVDFGRRFFVKNPQEIINQIVDAVGEFRQLAEEAGVERYWIDQIERHFVEMNPELLSSASCFLPEVYSFDLEDGAVSGKETVAKEDGTTIVKAEAKEVGTIAVTEAKCEEMNNGAMRLSAKLNSVGCRATFPPKSPVTAEIKAKGGIHMAKADMSKFVRKYLIDMYLVGTGRCLFKD